MRNKFGNFCMALGAALIFGALTLFLYNQREARRAEERSSLLLPQLVEELESVEAAQPLQPEVPKELLTAEDVKMTETIIDGRAYIGYLSMPSLELELPILSNWNNKYLQIAPCRYYGTLKGGDLVLMAHNYRRHFGRLGKLNEGDLVIFTDMDGMVTEYEVVARDILDPYAVEEMTAGDFDLTLFTCTYGGRSRITVYCDKVRE